MKNYRVSYVRRSDTSELAEKILVRYIVVKADSNEEASVNASAKGRIVFKAVPVTKRPFDSTKKRYISFRELLDSNLGMIGALSLMERVREEHPVEAVAAYPEDSDVDTVAVTSDVPQDPLDDADEDDVDAEEEDSYNSWIAYDEPKTNGLQHNKVYYPLLGVILLLIAVLAWRLIVMVLYGSSFFGSFFS